MNYNEFEAVMRKLNIISSMLDFHSDDFSQDFYEEIGIYWVLDNTVNLLTLFFRNNNDNLRDELFDCLLSEDNKFESKVANIYNELQENDDRAYLTQDEFCKQMNKLILCFENMYYFKNHIGDNSFFVKEIDNLIELNLDLLIKLTDDRGEILYNAVNSYAEYDFTDDDFIDTYNKLMEDR